MAGVAKTTKKLPAKPFTGAEGNSFAKDNQPSPQAKSEGWKKLRAQRLLTQAIIAHMTKEKNLETYISSLYTNAKKGNPKAIETINKGIEDDIAKVAFTDTEGNDVKPFQFILDERYKTGSDNSGIPT
jgi:uncharacterized protein YnzC (UPF0291/DUF896 family)